MKIYDIVIIGGGFVGASALLGLKRLSKDLKIALIDAAGPLKSEGDGRSIVLSYASQCIFSRWGYWQQLCQESFPLRAVHVSQAGRFGRIKITAQAQGVPALGYVVSADKLGTFLNTQTADCDYFHHTTCTHLERKGEQMELEIQRPEGTECWRSRLVLAADGANSKIRALAGIPVEVLPYDQQAIVTEVTVKHPNQTGYERFIGNEALAMVPRGGHQYGVIWKASNLHSHELMHLSPPEFLDILASRLGYRLGTLSELGVRKTYPLRRIRALKETLPGLVLLGDAAHANPPMAAQGLNLSLRDMAVLIDKIEVAMRTNQDFCSGAFLQEYENQRLADQAKIISLINFPLSRTFQAIPDPLKGLAWLGIDLCGGIKGQFANTMMGL